MNVPVTIWTTPTCPDCRALKAWFDETGIVFAERDLSEPDLMNEAKERFGVRVAPITQIGDWFTYETFAEQRPRIVAQLQRRAS